MLFRAGDKDVAGAQGRVRGNDNAHRTVNASELLNHGHVLDVTQTGAAIGRRKDHAHQTQLRELAGDFAREALGLVPLHDVRPNLALGKFPHRALDSFLFVGQLKIQESPRRRRQAVHSRGRVPVA